MPENPACSQKAELRRRLRLPTPGSSPIEDRQLGDRAARAINAEYLFAPVGRALVYADVSGLNHIKSRARFTFAKYHLSRRVMAGNRTLGQETQLAFRQPGEDGNLRQRLPNFVRGVRHGEYCTRARRPIRICVHLSGWPPWQSTGRCTRPPKAAGGEINCKGGLGMKNALPRRNLAQSVGQLMGIR